MGQRQNTYDLVAEGYSHIAKQGATDAYASRVATAFGYTPDQLASIPRGSNMGLCCGNPVALAGIKEGETIVDLGSGGGFDVFLAAEKIGASGKAIGIDVNPDMLALARRNASLSADAAQIEFLHSRITALPLPAGSVDCVISNCVVNLVPDAEKPQVFGEMARVLKVGGRVAISDILAKQELPNHIKVDAAMLVGCIAGASRVEEYERWLKEAGFRDVLIVDTQKDINVYKTLDPDGSGCGQGAVGCCGGPKPQTTSCCGGPKPQTTSCCGGPKSQETSSLNGRLGDEDLNQWVGSFQIYAVNVAKAE